MLEEVYGYWGVWWGVGCLRFVWVLVGGGDVWCKRGCW